MRFNREEAGSGDKTDPRFNWAEPGLTATEAFDGVVAAAFVMILKSNIHLVGQRCAAFQTMVGDNAFIAVEESEVRRYKGNGFWWVGSLRGRERDTADGMPRAFRLRIFVDPAASEEAEPKNVKDQGWFFQVDATVCLTR